MNDNETQLLTRRARCEKLIELIYRLDSIGKLLTSFDEDLWNAMVETITVQSVAEITITFKVGEKLHWTS